MGPTEETAKRLGLKADPSWGGNEAYWAGRLNARIVDLEAGLREIARGVHNGEVCAAMARQAIALPE